MLLGLVFFAGGITYFFMEPPKDPIPEAAMAFMGALMKTGYMMPFLKGTETLAGALLLCGRFVPLALAVLAPIIINIAACISFLMPSPGGIIMVVVLVALELYLAWAYRGAFRPMLAAQVTPG